MKSTRNIIIVIFIIFAGLMAFIIGTKKSGEKAQAAMEKQVIEDLWGAWERVEGDVQLIYLIQDQHIEQSAYILNGDGTKENISIGNFLNVNFNILGENQIQLYSQMTGQVVEGDIVTFEKPDNDTLVFDGQTFTRFYGDDIEIVTTLE